MSNMLLTGEISSKLAVLLPVLTMEFRDLIDRYKWQNEKARRSKGQASADRTKQPLSSSLAKGDLRLPCVCWGFLFPCCVSFDRTGGSKSTLESVYGTRNANSIGSRADRAVGTNRSGACIVSRKAVIRTLSIGFGGRVRSQANIPMFRL